MVCLFTVQLKATNKPKIIFASAKNTRTKVVLARILEKQGLGGTPVGKDSKSNQIGQNVIYLGRRYLSLTLPKICKEGS